MRRESLGGRMPTQEGPGTRFILSTAGSAFSGRSKRTELKRHAFKGELTLWGRLQKFVSIQYLRGIAAFLVVLYHATGNSEARLMFGVDLFFVISGFIMWVTTYDREITSLQFLKKRFIRIAPLYWTFTLIAAFVVMQGGMPRLQLDVDWGYLATSLAFLPGLDPEPHYATLPSVFPILPVGWTLNLEMFFYVIFAIMLLFSPLRRLIGVVSVLGVLVLIGLLVNGGYPPVMFYTSSIILEFAAGVLLGWLFTSDRLPEHWGLGAILFVVGILLLIFLPLPFDVRGVTWGVPALLICTGTLMLEPLIRKYPVFGMELLGDASYSLYLSHIPALAAAHALLPKLGIQNGSLTVSASIVLATLVGILVYQIYERPLTKVLRDRFR